MPADAIFELLRDTGLTLSLPPIVVRVRSPLHDFCEQLGALYSGCEVVDTTSYADIDIRMMPVRGARNFIRPQVQFVVDGTTPFDPFPRTHALPMFEWGLNWMFAHRMHDHLLLHSAVVERDGGAILLPAWPGSGKSTLAVSLMCRGWRFLSDEFGVISFTDARVRPFVRPAALKNASIDVVRAFDPTVYVGPVFAGTRKGDVAHLRPDSQSVGRSNEQVRVVAIVFPDFRAAEPVDVRPLGPSTTFLKLAGNAFNYEVVGEAGFRAVSALVRTARSCILRYGELGAAHVALDAIVAEHRP